MGATNRQRGFQKVNGTMMRLQYESFLSKLYKLIDDEFELDTTEGAEVFKTLGNTLFDLFMKRKKS